MGTTAAPGFFPKAKVVNSNFTKDSVWSDGGILLNSPSYIMHHHLEQHKYKINTMNYFSSSEEYTKGYNTQWPAKGQLYIARHAKDRIIDANQRLNDKIILEKLGDKMITLSVPIPDELSKLDNSSSQNINKLLEAAADHILLGGLGNGYFKAFIDNIIKDNLQKCQSTLNINLYQKWFSNTPPKIMQDSGSYSLASTDQENIVTEELVEKMLLTKDTPILTISAHILEKEEIIQKETKINKNWPEEDLGYISEEEDEEESAYDQLCGHQMADDGAPVLEGIDLEPMDIDGLSC